MFALPPSVPEFHSKKSLLTDVQGTLKQATLLIRGTEVYLLENGTHRTLQSGDSIEIHASAVIVLKQEKELTCIPIVRITAQFLQNDRVSVVSLRGKRSVQVNSCRRAELLAELAGRRLRDRTKGTAPSEEGWVEKPRLAVALDVNLPYVNTLLFRLRKLCPLLGIGQGSSLVETRAAMPGAKCRAEQVRLASSHVSLI